MTYRERTLDIVSVMLDRQPRAPRDVADLLELTHNCCNYTFNAMRERGMIEFHSWSPRIPGKRGPVAARYVWTSAPPMARL